eukprot:6212393-Pleurochrysis_carterae.AAC.4
MGIRKVLPVQVFTQEEARVLGGFGLVDKTARVLLSEVVARTRAHGFPPSTVNGIIHKKLYMRKSYMRGGCTRGEVRHQKCGRVEVAERVQRPGVLLQKCRGGYRAPSVSNVYKTQREGAFGQSWVLYGELERACERGPLRHRNGSHVAQQLARQCVGKALVLPVGGESLLRVRVHLAGADLHFHLRAARQQQCVVHRAVAVGLGRRDVVLDAAADRWPQLANLLQRLKAVVLAPAKEEEQAGQGAQRRVAAGAKSPVR